MSRSLNRVQIIGNLGADPELRTTPSGARVATLSVATSRRWNDRQGQQQEKTEWHRIIFWEKLAEVCESYLKRGDRVYVEGSIEYRKYEDKDGQTKYTTEIRGRGDDHAGWSRGERAVRFVLAFVWPIQRRLIPGQWLIRGVFERFAHAGGRPAVLRSMG